MKQQKIQIPKIQTLLDTSNYFYQNLLGYKPEQTSLQQIPEIQWNEFAEQRGLNPNSSGIYLPRNQTAVIQGKNPLSLFHEYFGHGLYCEQNLTGRKLVDLERRLLEEEKQEFSSGRFTLEDVQRYREQNQTFQELENFRKENLGKYELFAIWTEYLLSGENNLREDFERKYDSLVREEKEAIDSVIWFSEQHGTLATMYAQGMARRTTPERVGRLLEDIYKDKLRYVKFALLYGSKKEFSDIDVFMVDGEIPRIRNNWIDIFSYSQEEFEEKRRLFDVEVTDPLFSGEMVFGDVNYINQQRNSLSNQSITEKAIQHNLREAEKQEKLAYTFLERSEWRRISLSYALTSRLMAENLMCGKRIFTKNDFEISLYEVTPRRNNDSSKYSHSEKFIEMKGGIK
jgi:hypothetical protein